MSIEQISNSELIKMVSTRSEVEEATVGKVIEATSDVVTEQIKAGKQVTVGRLGKFGARHIEERKGRNPQSGEELTIAAHERPFFKPAKHLKDALN